MSFATQRAADVAATMVTAEFGETITYTPYGTTSKSIVCWVRRSAVGPDGQLRAVATQDPEIWIERHATRGVASPTTKDTVSMAAHPGGSAVTYRVGSIIPTSDAEVWHLRLIK